MRKSLFIFIGLILGLNGTVAQQNWAAVPCFSIASNDYIAQLIVNEAQNEIILCNSWSYDICTTKYKGIFAFNGNSFHDMDFGFDPQNPNPYFGGVSLSDVASFGSKAIVAGGFFAVGRDTLYSKGIAEWDGSKWNKFSKPLWNNTPNWNTGGGISKMLAFNGGVYIFANYDTTGSYSTKQIIYDGVSNTILPTLPVTNQSAITEAIIYKNKLVVSGGFYNYPSFDYFRLAQFDGTSWQKMGAGITGNISAVQTVAIYNDTLYIGGAFPKGNGNAGNYLVKWDGNQFYDANFSPYFCGYGAIWSLVPHRGKLYAFGNFRCAAGQTAFGVAYYQNGVWTVPQDSIGNNSIIAAVEYKDNIYIGGGFQSINGDTTIQKFAKLLCPDFDAATGCLSGLKELTASKIVKVFPNPTSNKLVVSTNNQVTLLNASIVNTLGQTVSILGALNDKQELDLSEMARGVYYLKFELNQNQYYLKVLKE